jgi:signal transduction histidine kinase
MAAGDNDAMISSSASSPASASRRFSRLQPSEVVLIDEQLSFPARLRAVAQCGMLDSAQEESFDVLTQLAARLLKVPASFVSIIDQQRDFYKSQFGFPVELAAERQMAGRTFCHFTLVRDEMLVIDDTHSHPSWQAVSTVKSLGVRAYVGVPLKVGGQTIGSFCVMDVQPRIWSDDELDVMHQLALSVGRELNLRASLLAAVAESSLAQKLAREREELFAVVAHDLRTPLQILQLSTTLLQRDPQIGQHPVVARMKTAVSALMEMASGLLASSATIAQAEVQARAVNAGSLVTDAVDMMVPIAERASIALVVGELADVTVHVDYAQLLRVMGNLIGNSIKYSNAGSVVTVAARAACGFVELVVSDQGRGMTPDEQINAFNQGWQGAEGLARGDGAGLGLAIVKKLVEGHGGSVSLASEPGQGSTLTISLPCR